MRGKAHLNTNHIGTYGKTWLRNCFFFLFRAISPFYRRQNVLNVFWVVGVFHASGGEVKVEGGAVARKVGIGVGNLKERLHYEMHLNI